MNIQWYPGHMAKAKRQIQENLKLIDIVVELIDARIPMSSQNPDISEIYGKPRIKAATKWDLADPEITKLWQNYWQRKGEVVVLLDLLCGNGIGQLRNEIQKSLPKIKRLPRILVVGIPNVGKSTLINRLAGKGRTKVGARPGVTKGKQWILAGGLQLLDTPGVLWPKIEAKETAYKLAAVASIRDEVYDVELLAYWLLDFLVEKYPECLVGRYGLNSSPHNESVENIMNFIGQRRGCLRAGGLIDLPKTAQVILKDFRLGLIGPISLELPEVEG